MPPASVAVAMAFTAGALAERCPHHSVRVVRKRDEPPVSGRLSGRTQRSDLGKRGEKRQLFGPCCSELGGSEVDPPAHFRLPW